MITDVKIKLLLLLTIGLFTGIGLLVLSQPVFAARLGQAAFRPNRLAASISSAPILVVAGVSSTAPTEAKIRVVVPSGSFTIDGTVTNVTGSTASMPTTFQGVGLTAFLGTGTSAVSIGTTHATFSISDITTTGQYGFFITGGFTNPGAGVYIVTVETLTSGDAVIDSSTVAVRIIAADQITVSASIDPTFTFVLGGTAAAFGTLTTSTTFAAGGVSITMTTNADKGWTSWIKSANAALNSATTGDVVSNACTVNTTPETLSAGSEGYGVDVDITTDSATSGTGTVSITGEYNGTAGAQAGCLSSSALQEMAYANGPTDNDVITVVPKATISALNAAASDYADTLTVVGAGNF